MTGPENHDAASADIQIRRGVRADVGALQAIECEVFDLERLTTRAFRRYLALEGADLIVATGAGEIAGYALMSYRRGSARGRLVSIAVATRTSGRGIGTVLLQQLHGLARARATSAIRLEVRHDNLAGLNLYSRAGYVAVGRKPAYYADFCDAIVMEYGLS